MSKLMPKMIQPNTGFNFLSGINRINQVPASIPIIANAEKVEQEKIVQ